MKITKAELNKAYSINRSIQRLYYEKTPLRVDGLAYRVIKAKINELENELELFPFHIQLRVREMQDSRDFNRDKYEGANWTHKWHDHYKTVQIGLVLTQIQRFARTIRARQLGLRADVFDSIPY